jgi:hypothetical protein
MRATWLHYALGALLVALGLWFYMNFERVTVREHVGFKGEAARKPLLAFTRLLERMGVQVRAPRERLDPGELPAGATLILPSGREAYTPAHAEALHAWVAAGGHLLVKAERPRTRDSVLDALKIGRKESRSGSPALAPVRFPHAERSLNVQMPMSFEIVDLDPSRTRFVAKGRAGTTVLHLEVGRGRVTVVPSMAFLTNDSIGEHDHAAFAWELLRLVPETTAVVIAPHIDPPSIFTWLAGNARAALAGMAALLLAWAWRAAVRFGPAEPEPARERRRLLDHLRASGRFLWRASAEPKLLAAARETCLHRISRTRPALLDLQPGDRAERLAALTGLARGDILHALVSEPDTPAAFTAAVRTLQQVEEKLTRKPTGSR